MRIWNKIFKDIELAGHLEVSLQAVRQYPKNKLELMRLGFACIKLKINYNDLLEFSKNKEDTAS
ncbi:hypothetical protein [Sulfurimonas sp.]|uniref:hypothetical protein n=1 Tax=Sulfurimonas sp. TaxID=2022749 RepID=UPI0025D729D6|nr:hypothetical protein [Sulfurimonas sp.]